MGGVASAIARSLDGRTRTISGVALVPACPPTSAVEVEVQGRGLEFTAGVLSFGRAIARDGANIEMSESFKYQGGTLLVGFGPDNPYSRACVGVWEGSQSSMMTYIENVSVSQLIELFDIGEITETEDGIVFSIDTDRARIKRRAMVMQGFADIGVIATMPMGSDLRKEVPSWRGTLVQGGELFVDRTSAPFERAEQAILHLFNERSATRIIVAPGTDERRAVETVSNMKVEWS